MLHALLKLPYSNKKFKISQSFFLLYVRIRMIPSLKFSSCPPCFNMPGRNGFHSIGVYLTEKMLSFPTKRETKVKEYTSMSGKTITQLIRKQNKKIQTRRDNLPNISPRVSNINKDSKKQKMYANKVKLKAFWDSNLPKRQVTNTKLSWLYRFGQILVRDFVESVNKLR